MAEKVLVRRLSLEGIPMGISLSRSPRTRWSYQFLIGVLLLVRPAAAQTTQPGIEDNSFLIEEAYNQERGVVQHISTFSRMWNTKDWAYNFTQEWPLHRFPRHQLSYTLVAAHAGGSTTGWGDTILNYRYQLVGNGESHTAFAPRLSLLLPTGDVSQNRGVGGVGVQIGLPVSVVLHSKLVTHWNAGATFVAHAQDAVHDRASTAGYNLGQSFVWLAHTRLNVLMETIYASSQSVVGMARAGWSRSVFFSPGIRWSYNFKSGMQIVPGIAVPVGIGPSAGDNEVFLYFSVERPLARRRPK